MITIEVEVRDPKLRAIHRTFETDEKEYKGPGVY